MKPKAEKICTIRSGERGKGKLSRGIKQNDQVKTQFARVRYFFHIEPSQRLRAALKVNADFFFSFFLGPITNENAITTRIPGARNQLSYRSTRKFLFELLMKFSGKHSPRRPKTSYQKFDCDRRRRRRVSNFVCKY